MNGTESNRVPLQVLPERQLDTLTVNGTIPNLIYNDDTANTFDLNTLNVEAKDQYGEDMTLDDGLFEWRLATDKAMPKSRQRNIGLVVGTGNGHPVLSGRTGRAGRNGSIGRHSRCPYR